MAQSVITCACGFRCAGIRISVITVCLGYDRALARLMRVSVSSQGCVKSRWRLSTGWWQDFKEGGKKYVLKTQGHKKSSKDLCKKPAWKINWMLCVWSLWPVSELPHECKYRNKHVLHKNEIKAQCEFTDKKSAHNENLMCFSQSNWTSFLKMFCLSA